MKQLLLCLVIFLTSQILFSQECSNTYSFSNYYREVPIQSGNHVWEEQFFLEATNTMYSSSFASNLWLMALGPDENFRMNVNSYRPRQPGPLRDTDGNVFENACDYFDRLWIISGADIQQHKQNYIQGIAQISNTPKDILQWPARGNPYFDIGNENGTVLNQELAPFFDTNMDGIYNAIDGDIPIFKSGIAFNNFEDVWAPYIFSFNVVNDGDTALLYGEDRLKSEILQSSYMLNCGDSRELNYTVFHNFNINYKGTEDLHGLKVAYWEDGDLGCFDNDLLGCSPGLSTVYYYNETPVEDFCPAGIQAIDLPWGISKNTILLSHELSSFIYYNNGAVGLPFPATIDPNTAVQTYNLMCGVWLDGTPLTAMGDGYNPGSTDVTKYAFSDLPNDPNGWSMINEPLSFSDRRSVLGIETVEFLNPGENIVIDIASQVMFDETTFHVGIYNKLEETVEEINTTYELIQTDPSLLTNCAVALNCTENCVWPGNVVPDNQVDALDFLTMGAIMSKDFGQGIKRSQLGDLWAPHDAIEWSAGFQGVNLNQADCDGNGRLTQADLDVISKNFGRQKPNTESSPNNLAPYDPEGFKVTSDKSEVDLTSSILSRSFSISIRPRDEGEHFDFPYHGVSFDIVFDSTLVTPFTPFVESPNEEFFNETLFSGAFFNGDPNPPNSFEWEGDNRISFVITSGDGIDQMPSSNLINSYGMVLKEDAATRNLDGRDTMQFRMENILFIDSEGNVLEEVGYYSDEIIFTNLNFDPTSSITSIEEQEEILLSPNPAVSELRIEVSKKSTTGFKVINLQGIELDKFELRNDLEKTISLKDYPAGVYVVQFYNDIGRMVGIEKFVVIK